MSYGDGGALRALARRRRCEANLTRILSKLPVVGLLVLAAAVVIPLLRAKRAFAPHTPLAFGAPAPRPSMRRRVGSRRLATPRRDLAATETLACDDGPSLAGGDSPALLKAPRDLPVPRRARRVEAAYADSGARVVSARSASFTPPALDVPGDLAPPAGPRALPRPAILGTLTTPKSLTFSPRSADDVPAPPPRSHAR